MISRLIFFSDQGSYFDNCNMQELPVDVMNKEIFRIIAMDRDRLTLNNFLRRKYLVLYRKFIKTRQVPLQCQAMASTCLLDPFGNIFPCLAYERKVINIKDTPLSLKAIWQQQQTKKIHRECATGQCPGCWYPCDAYSAIGGSLLKMLITR